MPKWDRTKEVFTTICQKCDAPPTITRLSDVPEFLPGVIHIPDILHCGMCGAQLTVQARPAREDELKKFDDKDKTKS